VANVLPQDLAIRDQPVQRSKMFFKGNQTSGLNFVIRKNFWADSPMMSRYE
jgi:hypothetical protein